MPKKPTSSKKAKKSAGRPRLEFDLQQVEQLAGIQCTDGEIAAVRGCSRQTILNLRHGAEDDLPLTFTLDIGDMEPEDK